MASVYWTGSLLAASDEIFEHVCVPCKTEGNIKESRQYCWDCQEYLCDKCVKYHRKLTLTSSHNIEAADTIPAGQGRRLIVYCGCNRNNETEFYCEDHADVICSTCKIFKHHQCQTISIQQKSSGYTASKFESIIARAMTLKGKCGQLIQECSADQIKLKRSKEDCKKEIKCFRKDLDEFLDKLERDMLAELDQLEIKENQQIKSRMTLLTTALQMLDTNCQLLNNARKDRRKQAMFAADILTSNDLRDYENRLVDLEKEIGHFSVLFEKNKQLGDLQREIKKIGSLSTSRTVAMKRETAGFMGREITSGKEIFVRNADDECDPFITGFAVMPNGTIVICDRWNENIKLLDNSMALAQSLKLSDPWDVSVCDTNNVVITSPDSRKLQYIQVFPKLKVDRVVELDKPCSGVHVAADSLYVTCHENSKGEVRVFDKQGNFMRRLHVSLSYPYYISVNTAGNKVFVSDVSSQTITCLTADGSIIYNYVDKDLKCPEGICCDDEGNVLVCDRDSNNVQLITSDGKKGGTLVSTTDGLKKPYSITFRKCDNTLIVGCRDHANIIVYNLTKLASFGGFTTAV